MSDLLDALTTSEPAGDPLVRWGERPKLGRPLRDEINAIGEGILRAALERAGRTQSSFDPFCEQVPWPCRRGRVIDPRHGMWVPAPDREPWSEPLVSLRHRFQRGRYPHEPPRGVPQGEAPWLDPLAAALHLRHLAERTLGEGGR